MITQQRGDTIVEVLLAIVIVSLVLASAFTAANKGQNLTQRTDERAVATGYLEDQTERLILAGKNSDSDVWDGATYCILTDFTVQATSSDPVAANANCQDGLYTYWLEEVPANPNTFQVSVQWERLGGSDGTVSTETATNYIRVYPND